MTGWRSVAGVKSKDDAEEAMTKMAEGLNVNRVIIQTNLRRKANADDAR